MSRACTCASPQVWNSTKALQQNIQNGTVIKSVLGGGNNAMAEAEEQMAQQLQGEQDGR